MVYKEIEQTSHIDLTGRIIRPVLEPGNVPIFQVLLGVETLKSVSHLKAAGFDYSMFLAGISDDLTLQRLLMPDTVVLGTKNGILSLLTVRQGVVDVPTCILKKGSPITVRMPIPLGQELYVPLDPLIKRGVI